MNPRITAAFVVALLVMIGLVVGLDRFKVGNPGGGTPTPTPNPELALFQFDDQHVAAFSGRAGDKTVRVSKNSDGRWVIDGSEAPANQASFSSLVIRLSQLKATSLVPADQVGGDLKQYGLDQPADQATAEMDDGATRYVLDLGIKGPIGTGVYAKRPDAGDVYIVSTQVQTDLERLVNDPTEPPTPTPRPSPTATVPLPAASETPTP
jgi:hypothetical protein